MTTAVPTPPTTVAPEPPSLIGGVKDGVTGMMPDVPWQVLRAVGLVVAVLLVLVVLTAVQLLRRPAWQR